MKMICVDCESVEVYEIEFRTDYVSPRKLNPLNTTSNELDEKDLPYHLGGYYCHNCGGFCSVKEASE